MHTSVGMKRKLEDVNGDDNLCLIPCSQPKKQFSFNNYSHHHHHPHPQLVDLFGQLPEEIIANILSYLKLKDAVQTSILSHSFKNACTSLRSIQFDWDNVFPLINNLNNITQLCCCMDYKQKFITCVNQYLQFNQATNLLYLKIYFCFQVDDKEVIDGWLRIILSRDVENLQLFFCCPHFDTYLSNNFCRRLKWYSFSGEFCGALRKLRRLCLGACQIEKDFRGNFNSLTSLSLRRVVFNNCDLQNLLHSMPNLESLNIRSTILPEKLSFNCLPFLKILRLFNCHKLKEMELRSDVLHGIYFKLDRVVKINWSALPNMTTIGVNANADVLHYMFTHFPTKYPFLRLLTSFSYCDWGSCIPDSISKFSHLEILKLYLFSNCTFDILKLIHVLRALPHLSHLGLLTNCTTEVQRSELEIGEFMLQSLENVNIMGLFSTPSEIELIIYLLKSAPALKNMSVCKTKDKNQAPWDRGQREHIYKRIQEALEGGRNVKVKMLP